MFVTIRIWYSKKKNKFVAGGRKFTKKNGEGGDKEKSKPRNRSDLLLLNKEK